MAQWLRCCATNRRVAGSITDGVIGIFHWQSSRSHYGPGVDSASNRNEYQENFLGVNAASAYRWQPYHLPVPLSWNLGTLTSWNPLGHSRPVTGLVCLYFIYLTGCGTVIYFVYLSCIIQTGGKIVYIPPAVSLGNRSGKMPQLSITLVLNV